MAVIGTILAAGLTGISLVLPYFTKPRLNDGLGASGGEPRFNVLLTYVLALSE